MSSSLIESMALLAEGEASPSPGILWTAPVWIFIAVFFYFLFIRPDQKRRAEMQSMLQALKKNDRVETIGGVRGVVVLVDSEEVVLRVDDNTNARLHFRRDAISRVLKGDEKKESS